MLIDFLKERKNVVQIIIVSVFLALGIGFLGQGTAEVLELDGNVNIVLGLVLIIPALILLILKLAKQRSKDIVIRGSIYYNKNTNHIINIPGYSFNEKVVKYMNSAFKENKGLEKIWSKIPLDNIASTNGALSSKDLLFQLSEYIFLNKLSMHLIAYFGNTKVNKKKLRTYKRNDIPQVLLQNAFLELFTKSMNQRAAFIDSFKTKADPRIIQISTETDGHLYENLILTLPKKCKIEKPSKTELNIKTKKLSINTRFSISGWESIENDNFLKYYAGVSDSSDIRKYTLDLNVQVNFSFLSYFSNLGWTYFKWIDSFINTFSSEFSENIFKSRINWNTINTIAIMNENSKKLAVTKVKIKGR